MTRSKEQAIKAKSAPAAVPQRAREEPHHRYFLQTLGAQNLLSFGPETSPLQLERLNVLVGPNGSGKSNLLEVIALLRSTSRDIRPVISRGGGAHEWIWKGNPRGGAAVTTTTVNPWGVQPIYHELAFMDLGQGLQIVTERIGDLERADGKPFPFYEYKIGTPPFFRPLKSIKHRSTPAVKLDPSLSILAQLRDPWAYPDITFLATTYEDIRLFREWSFGRNTVFREPQRADLRNDRMEEDFSNLGLFLNSLRRKPKAKAAVLSHLKDLYEGLTDFDVSVEGGTVQVFFTEGDFTIPATRLSDGSLRYLCLLAILCDPEPPPLIGIEEPELGLHPDLIPKIADLLIEASQRTQLIVTTHSDILIDALSERPECVVVCEKHEGQTTMRRLDRAELAEWLKTYRLGQLWTRGHLGGTRW